MLQNIIFLLVVAVNLTVNRISPKVFWSLYGFLIWCMTIIVLSISGFDILSLAIAVVWIHGLLKFRPILKKHLHKAIAEPYVSGSVSAEAPGTPLRPKIDPENIQGSFYGLSGYTSNPYERIENP